MSPKWLEMQKTGLTAVLDLWLYGAIMKIAQAIVILDLV